MTHVNFLGVRECTPKYILLLARWFGPPPILTDGTDESMRIWYIPGRV